MEKNVFKPVDDEIVIEAIIADRAKYKECFSALVEFAESSEHARELDWEGVYKSQVAAFNSLNSRLKQYGISIKVLCYETRIFLVKEDFYDEHYYG